MDNPRCKPGDRIRLNTCEVVRFLQIPDILQNESMDSMASIEYYPQISGKMVGYNAWHRIKLKV